MTEQPRELGVAVTTCANCDGTVKQVTLADGGVTGQPCDKCYPDATPVVAETEKASETTSVPREQGTTIVTEEN